MVRRNKRWVTRRVNGQPAGNRGPDSAFKRRHRKDVDQRFKEGRPTRLVDQDAIESDAKLTSPNDRRA
ncbi:hypothetical protein MTO96_035264 [Rhipicephalus appendiculatus]